MAITINGTTGLAGVDGSAGTPALQGADTNTGIFFPAADTIAFSEGGAEVARFDSSGNLGIGTSSPVSRLTIAGASAVLSLVDTDRSVNTYGAVWADQAGNLFLNADYDGTAGGGIISFRSNGSALANEKMRIDSSGNLLVGTTALRGSERVSIQAASSSQGLNISQFSTSGNPTIFKIETGLAGGAIGTGRFIDTYDGGSNKFFIAGSGVVNSTSTSITSISDFRLKENIRDLETGLDAVMTLKPRRFDWKEGQGTNKKDVAGFIAQEVETVLPDLIGEWKNNESDETTYKSLSMGDMLPTLVKAIQEQQALITALTARITALETP